MKTAWLFPGQGAQKVGMGKDVAEAFSSARKAFAEADAALGENLSGLCFEGPAEDLTLTANTQPALIATSTALLCALKEKYPGLPAPDYVAGHSLGEYSALVAAGAWSLSDAVKIARIRGKAMQEAVPAGVGAMAAVMGLSPEDLEAICAETAGEEVVSPANFNGGQIVIAGHKAAVERASAACKAKKARVIPLKVSAPFHCALMAPAAKAVGTALETLAIVDPSPAVVANVDAQPNTSGERVKELLVRQIDGVVRWQQTVQFLAENGVTHAIEIGPGKVLAGLVKRIDKRIKVAPCSDLKSLDGVGEFLGL